MKISYDLPDTLIDGCGNSYVPTGDYRVPSLDEYYLPTFDTHWVSVARYPVQGKHFIYERKIKCITTREEAFAWAKKNPKKIVKLFENGYISHANCWLFNDGVESYSVLTDYENDVWVKLTEIEV